LYSLDHLKHPADEGEAASKGTAATETLSLLCGKVVELISAATDPEKLKDMPPAWHPWF
jgi:phosphatidylinositol kinase/protein kinase (PI-3  family)